MSYVVGIDAGGTKTQAVVYDNLKKPIYTSSYGMGNINVDKENAIANIIMAVDGCLPYVKGGAFICVGAAGITAKGNREALETELLARYPQHDLHITTDAHLALYAKLEGKDGILLISGTGSVVFGKARGKIERVGGWGNILGDEGSGYAMALSAIKALLGQYDDGKPYSPLSERLLESLGATSVSDIIHLVYQRPKGEVAALFKTIVDMAERGDDEAIEILLQGADDLCTMVYRLALKMDFQGTVPIALSGSVVTHVPAIRQRLLKRLKERGIHYTLCEHDHDAPLGAVYILYDIEQSSK